MNVVRYPNDAEDCDGRIPHRLLRLAYVFAEAHMGDGDECGEYARELRTLILNIHPEFENEHS
jgi:hypothetical protein